MLTMEEALKQSAMGFAAGEIVKGTVIEVRPKEVLIDIGYKSEGVIPANEFQDIKAVKVGDEVNVLIEKLEDKDGMVVLSKEKAEFKQNWDRILTICNEGGTVTGKVKAVVKGGLLVNIGVEAFLPASQIDIIPPKNLTGFVGNSYEFKVVKINQERQNVVLSRRELIEQERTERRQKLLTEMTPGDIRKGTVKNITDFGAFIDLNGLDGLLHITREKERVSLGLKQKLANPWESIESRFQVGNRVKGKVVNLVPYGAFVELEPGVEGLVHVTELSWTKRIAKPSDKALEKYPPGTRVKGRIRNLTSYGAFIELEEGLDGMIHVSDISWTRKINHPSEDPWSNIDKFYKVGDLVTGQVTKLASFGAFVGLQHDIDGLVHISQVSEDRVEKIKNVLKVGQEVTARVIKIDKTDRRIGLSIKAANYSQEQLKAEQALLDSLKPGEDLVALQHAFDAADEEKKQENP